MYGQKENQLRDIFLKLIIDVSGEHKHIMVIRVEQAWL